MHRNGVEFQKPEKSFDIFTEKTLAIAIIQALENHQWSIQKDFYTGIPVWAPKFWRPKKIIYTIILHRRLCFLLLNLSKVYFYVRKHTFSIVNHPAGHQHFNTSYSYSYCVRYSLFKITCFAGNDMPKQPLNVSLTMMLIICRGGINLWEN